MSDLSLREALEAIYARRGELTPALVVDEARANRSNAGRFLRSRLEWDDKVAGEAYRREQAAELIRSVKVTYREATETEVARQVRGFHSVRTPDGMTYKPLMDVVEDEFSRQLVLADMQREWKALHRRYSHFEEFVRLVRADIEAA